MQLSSASGGLKRGFSQVEQEIQAKRLARISPRSKKKRSHKMANETLRSTRVITSRSGKSPEEVAAEVHKWADENPQKADDAIQYLRRIVYETPIHTALLGQIGERFGIPKPVSAFYRAFCDEFLFLSATLSPVGSPAICLRGKLRDETYRSSDRKSVV